MWTSQQEIINDQTTKYQLLENGRPLSYREVIVLWRQSDPFILFFASILQESPCEGYFWEVKPVTISQWEEIFEFVLVESLSLPKVKADASRFKPFFPRDPLVVSFPNLGKDAMLIVPVPVAESTIYAHIGSFMRKAPQDQILAFWRTVGEEMEMAVGEEKRWLSTHGLGVYWLHVRIDSRPKYYHYRPYK